MRSGTGVSRWQAAIVLLSVCLLGPDDGEAASEGWGSRRKNNSPPQITGTPTTTAVAGQPYAFQPVATDADGDRLKFAIRNQPRWAGFDMRTGALLGTPGSADVGSYADILITVSDSHSYAVLPKFTILVAEDTAARVNEPPIIHGTPPTAVTAGSPYAFQPTASDPEGVRLSFAIRNRPAWANFDASTGRLSGTPASSNVGSYSDVGISVTDGQSFTDLAPFSIQVNAAPNQAPAISGSPATSVTAAQAYAFTPSASDADGDVLTFSIQNRPAWATFSPSTGRLSGTPTDAQVGTYSNVMIGVSDGKASASLAPFDVVVSAVPNRAPTIAGQPAVSVTAGQAYSFTPSASDADGDALTFSIQNRPAWATFSSSTGRMSGTPTSAQVGTYSNVVISVSDGKTSASLAPFSVEVVAVPNRAPTITGQPAASVTADQSYSFTPAANDPDGDVLTFSIQNRPAWATFSPSTGRLSGTPTGSYAGTYANVVISVTDGKASASLPAFSIIVEPVVTRSVTLSWQAPTRNEDGTPLTDLAGYQVHYGQVSGQYSQTLSLPDAAYTSVTIEDLTPATWYFAVKAVNSAGVVSGFSNVASKSIN
jgi:Putative Ig domain